MFSSRCLAQLASPIGVIYLLADGQQVVEISFSEQVLHNALAQPVQPAEHPLISQVAQELGEYFDQAKQQFDFTWSFAERGTDFQRAVWQVISEIPYGQVMSYKEIAETLGKPRAYRAVANACGQNQLPIVVPCHRVVGSGAKGRYTLGGYSSGINKKRFLMELEGIEL